MANTVTTLTKDVWTKVLTNVTATGKVFIVDQEQEPTKYLVTWVATGAAAPATNFSGGVEFSKGFQPDETAASDYYVMPLNKNGKVVIYT